MDNSEKAAQVFDKHASFYMEKFMDVSNYHDSLDFFCKNLSQDASIIELACGPGNNTQYILKNRPDLKILATDLAPNMIRLAKENNPTAEFKVLDTREINQVEGIFDGMMCGFIFPYLTKNEVEKFISDAAGKLTTGGIIYISTMEQDNSSSGFETGSKGDQVYMNYHEGGYLIEFFKKYNFEIIYEDRKIYPGKDDKMITDLILICRKLE